MEMNASRQAVYITDDVSAGTQSYTRSSLTNRRDLQELSSR